MRSTWSGARACPKKPYISFLHSTRCDADFGVIESVWSFDAENKSTAQVHMAMTDEPFDRDTIAVGAKRLRLRKGVAPAKVRW